MAARESSREHYGNVRLYARFTHIKIVNTFTVIFIHETRRRGGTRGRREKCDITRKSSENCTTNVITTCALPALGRY